MSHAYLILGGSALSRREKALEFYTNLKPKQDPKKDPDTQILTGASSIKIEDVRDLGRTLSLTPYNQPPKVVTIINADRFTLEAQNAFLKLLEEPPGETVFILTTRDSQNLLETIVSRCQLVNLLTETEITIDKNELKKAREALLEILSSSPGKRIKAAGKIGGKEESIAFCQIQLTLWRETLLKKPTPEVAFVIREIQKTLIHLSNNVNPRLALENLLLSYPTN